MTERAALRPVSSALRHKASARSRSRALMEAVRWQQWVKNLLLFIAPVMARREGDGSLLGPMALGFAAFCATASGVYLFNDVIDAKTDRHHPLKRRRPFASGLLSPSVGWGGAILLWAAGLAIGAWLPWQFEAMLGTYIGLNLLYTLVLKKVAVLDVLVLSSFYTLRIFAGAFVTGVPISEWLLVFSLFFFFSLAIAKRAADIKLLEDRIPGRGYQGGDFQQLATFGTASGYVAVLVYGLYLYAPNVQALYQRPFLLWLIFPMLIFWISRIWLMASRGQLRTDPIAFALRDRTSYLVAAMAALTLWLARGTMPLK